MKAKQATKPRAADALSLTVALPAHLSEALDRFIAHEGSGLSRDQALARAFHAWALQNGFAHREDDGQEGKRPEELNATNDD